MIPIFERLYPGAVGEFFFDQSSAHGAFEQDALNAKEMNLKPGGKQRKMHPPNIPMDNPNLTLRGLPPLMVFPEDLNPNDPNYEHRGKAKGMLEFLKERDLLGYLERANGGKLPPGECRFCKGSRKTQKRLQREALAAMDGQDDPEGISEDIIQPGISITCCLPKFLSQQLPNCKETCPRDPGQLSNQNH